MRTIASTLAAADRNRRFMTLILLLGTASTTAAQPLTTSETARLTPFGESTVTRGDIGLRIERTGRVESSRRNKSEWKPEAYTGEVRVGEVLHYSGEVREGEVILRLVAKDLERDLTEANRQLEAARHRSKTGERERAMAEESTALAVTRATLAADVATREWKRWQEYGDAKSLEMNRLQVQGSADRLADEKEELSQLEKLYQGAALDNQTKDIVLERARRSLIRSERFTYYATKDGDIYRSELHADETRRASDRARDTALELAHALINQELGAIRNRLAAEDSAHGLAEAERKVNQLEADRAALEVKAPFSGVLNMAFREVGDEITRGASLCEVMDPQKLRVKVDLQADALRLAGVGSEVAVGFTLLPDRSCTGKISQIASVGTPSGDATVFPAFVDLPSSANPPPIGLDGRVEIRGSLKGVLMVPNAAVTTAADGTKLVRRKRGDSIEEVTVRLGATDGTNTEVVDGLSAGDAIEVPSA